jgi:hypothetical protein
MTASRQTAPNAGVSSRNRAGCGAAAVCPVGAADDPPSIAHRPAPLPASPRLGRDDATRGQRLLDRGEESEGNMNGPAAVVAPFLGAVTAT